MNYRAKRIRIGILLVFALMLLALVLYFTQIYWTKAEITMFIAQFGPLSMAVYVVIVILFNVAAPLSASPIMLLGFSLFDQWAIWLFALGNFTAMGINFWLARKFGRRLIQRIVGEEDMQKVDKVAQDHGFATLFIIRMFVSGLSDLASYAFGLTTIKFKPYIIISITASLPPLLLFVTLSQQFQNPIHLLLLQLLIGAALSAIYFVIRITHKRWQSK